MKKIINFKNPKRYLYIVIYLITNETKMITKNNNNNNKKKHCTQSFHNSTNKTEMRKKIKNIFVHSNNKLTH